LLIAGAPGAGKSALARTIITSLALNHQRNELGLVLVDSKGGTFGPLAALPHLLKPVLSEPQEASQVLQSLMRLVHKRGDKLQAPRVVLVIDDLADLLAATGDSTRQALVLLAQRGHEAGVHLIACTRKLAIVLSSTGITLDDFPTRLVGRVASAEQAQEVTGYAGTGAERLKAPGDFLAVTGGQITSFHAAFVTAREIAEMASQILSSLQPRPNGKADGINLPQVPVVTPVYPLPPIRHRERERIDL
jgi:S-DNA-T family DNA segregation ATPase FtsK/SpoIIIE